MLSAGLRLDLASIQLSPDDDLELLRTGPTSLGLPLESAESTVTLDLALTQSCSSTIYIYTAQ